MDREENKNMERNLWERTGRRGGLVESERLGRKGGSRYGDSHAGQGGSRYGGSHAGQGGSRYGDSHTGQGGSRYGDSHAGQSGSRYGDSHAGQSGSRYGDSHTGQGGSRYERTGSRYPDRGRETAAAALSKRNEKKGRPGIRDILHDPVKLALIFLGVVIVAAYVVVAVYFGGHFYSGSSIYGIDCSRMTSGQVKDEIRSRIGEYTLTIKERNGQQDVITASQINLQYQDDSGVDIQLKKQRSYVWPAMMMLGKSGKTEVHTTYERDQIDSVMAGLNCFLPGNIVAPQDAYRGDTETGYEVVAEVMGTTLDYAKTKETILSALDQGLVEVSLEEAGCYIDPVIYRDDPELNAEVEELNSLLTACVTIDFDDRQEVINASVIKEWIFQDENGDYYIDDNHIWAYVEQLAEKYDTFGCERIFYTSIGTAVTLSGGDYGWAMNQDATAEILAADVKAGKTETIQPVYVYTAMSREENDIGGTYVEVCISRQEMWCYQDGNLMVDTPVVTGNPNKGNGTPSGSVWAIDAKMEDYTLRGEGYAAPVDYWMPFNGDVGIHDMQNRYYFGGTIYLSNGSHGCINTPYEAAQTIYSIVSIGTPVIVYE